MSCFRRPLKSGGDVCELLEENINRIRQGPFDLRAANSIALQAGILLKALAQRVEAPETPQSGNPNGFYQSLVNRMASDPQNSLAPQEQAYSLYPEPPKPVRLGPLPAPGESVDAPPTPPNNHRGVITVEVG